MASQASPAGSASIDWSQLLRGKILRVERQLGALGPPPQQASRLPPPALARLPPLVTCPTTPTAPHANPCSSEIFNQLRPAYNASNTTTPPTHLLRLPCDGRGPAPAGTRRAAPRLRPRKTEHRRQADGACDKGRHVRQLTGAGMRSWLPPQLLNRPCAPLPVPLPIPAQFMRNLLASFQHLPAGLVYGGVHTAIADLMQRCGLAAWERALAGWRAQQPGMPPCMRRPDRPHLPAAWMQVPARVGCARGWPGPAEGGAGRLRQHGRHRSAGGRWRPASRLPGLLSVP